MKTAQDEEEEISSLVQNAIDSIISHYSHDIHHNIADEEDNINRTHYEDQAVPYFDPLLGDGKHYMNASDVCGGRAVSRIRKRVAQSCRRSDDDVGIEVNIFDNTNTTYSTRDDKQKKDETRSKNTRSTFHQTAYQQTTSLIVNQCLDKLWAYSAYYVNQNQTKNLENFLKIGVKLLESYPTQIRPKCFHFIHISLLDRPTASSEKSAKEGGKKFKCCYMEPFTHLVLIHYEMMLKEFIHSGTTAIIQIKSSSEEYHDHLQTIESSIQKVTQIIQGLLHDILHLTCVDKVSYNSSTDENDKKKIRDCIRNWILPTFLRIVQHSIQYVSTILQLLSIEREVKQLKDRLLSRNCQKIQSNIQRCISYALIIATSFCSDCNTISDNSHDTTMKTNTTTAQEQQRKQHFVRSNIICTSSDLQVQEILPNDWNNQLTLRHIMETCAYSPYEVPTIMESFDDIQAFMNDRGIHICTGSTSNSTAKELEGIKSILNEPFLSLEDHPSSSTLKMDWMDHVKGIGFRVGRSLLCSLHDLSMTSLHHCNPFENNQKCTTECSRTNQTMISTIVNALDIQQLLQVIRANFFGRLELPDQFAYEHDAKVKEEERFSMKMSSGSYVDKLSFNAIRISDTKESKLDDPDDDMNQIRVVKQISQKRAMEKKMESGYKPVYQEKPGVTSIDDKPYVQVKARIASSIRLMSSFTSHHMSSLVWSHSLPIIYSLIDSTNASQQSLGGALFTYLLRQDQSIPTSFFIMPDNKNHDTISNNLFETAVKVLSMSIRTSDDGVTLSILLSTLTNLCDIAEKSSIGERDISHARNDATTNVMTWMSKHSYCGPSGDPNIILALTANLTCGIHTLLYQIAQQPNAGALEMGRTGLGILLPMIRWDSSLLISRRIQFTAISSLISLMMGAYPIMKRHGGKIMAELISCIGRGLRDIKIHKQMWNDVHKNSNSVEKETLLEICAAKILVAFAVYAGSVALVLCGSSADEVLLTIQNGKYESSLVSSCAQIRKGASEMTKRTTV